MLRRRKAKRGVTIVDVAKALGLAPSTVSNALHDKAIVAPSTKLRILEKTREMKYEASAAARALVTRHSFSVGVLLPDFSNPVFNEIIKGLDEALSAQGYATLIASTEGDEAKRRGAVDAFLARSVDGIVLVSQSLAPHEVEYIADAGLPAIFVHRKPIDHDTGRAVDIDFDYVGMDNRGGLDAAVTHLESLGHRRIGLVCGPRRSSAADERTAGYRDAVARLNLECDPALIVQGNYEFIGGMEGARQLLSLAVRPTAIIAANDLMAFATMDLAQQMGLAVPHDLSIIGVDDIFVSAFPMISLTTVKQPAREIGNSVGARLLERFLTEDLPPSLVTLPAELVVRHSTSIAPIEVRLGQPLTPAMLGDYLAARWKPTSLFVA